MKHLYLERYDLLYNLMTPRAAYDGLKGVTPKQGMETALADFLNNFWVATALLAPDTLLSISSRMAMHKKATELFYIQSQLERGVTKLKTTDGKRLRSHADVRLLARTIYEEATGPWSKAGGDLDKKGKRDGPKDADPDKAFFTILSYLR